jgi:chemotaxis methyl-accepting protein methylase
MESIGIHEADKYGELIASDPAERAIFITLLRVTITRFYRNGWLWDELARQITHYAPGYDRFMVWSAGCAGGEETFSMAMLLEDLAEIGGTSLNWTVTGSDVDPPSLERARNASYQWGAVREVPPKLLERWFSRDSDEWYLDDKVRRMVTILPHDIINEEPPGRFNVVLLRNSVLTYNQELVRREVLERIRGCLDPPGLLVIGRTEKLPEGDDFTEVSRCIYKLA